MAETLPAPKIQIIWILLLYVGIHLLYLEKSFTKISAPNSKNSQSHNHAKILMHKHPHARLFNWGIHALRQRYRQHPQTIIRIASYYRSRITIRIIIRQSYSLHLEIYTELPCKALTLHVRWQSPSAPKTYRSHILLPLT